MGKPLPSSSKLYQFSKMATPNFKSQNTISGNQLLKPETSKSGSTSSAGGGSDKLKLRLENPQKNQTPIRLSEVVSDCVKRWFADTLKEAKSGDTTMQVLVGQMYYSGYGTPKDPHKGNAWITRASKIRSSALKVHHKQPGYNVSDSDSDELKDVADEVK